MQPEIEIVYGDVQDEVFGYGKLLGVMYRCTVDGRWYFEGGMLTVSFADRDDLIDWLMGD